MSIDSEVLLGLRGTLNLSERGRHARARVALGFNIPEPSMPHTYVCEAGDVVFLDCMVFAQTERVIVRPVKRPETWRMLIETRGDLLFVSPLEELALQAE